MSSGVTRRALLRVLALGVPAACLLGRSTAWASRDPVVASELRDALVALLPDRRSAGAVGSAYLARFPREADALALSRGLLALHDSPAQQGGSRDLSSAFRAQIRLDFASEHTVWLKGWCLSRTEARLCALRGLV